MLEAVCPRQFRDNSFADEATPHRETLLTRLSTLTDTAIVPSLWLYEVTNVAALAVRKGRITTAKARLFLDNLSDLAIEVEPLPGKRKLFDALPD